MRKSNVSFGRIFESNRGLLRFLKRGRQKRQTLMHNGLRSASALASATEGLEDRLLLSASSYDDYQAYDLDQELGLHTDGNYHENWGGADERWLAGEENPWYFITPNGQLHEWGGGTRVSMFADSLVVATLDTKFYDAPQLLTDAPPAHYNFALTVTPLATQSAATSGDFLTGPTSGDPLDLALDYLDANAASFGLTAGDITNHGVTDQYVSTHNNVTHIYLNQTYNTLPIAGSQISVNVMDDGRLLNAHSTFLPNLDTPTSDPQPTISALEALDALADNYGWGYREQPVIVSAQNDTAQTTELSGAGLSADNITAALQYMPAADGGVELAWNVNLYDIGSDFWLDTHISAVDGEILGVSDWVDNASYNVYALPGETPVDPDILDNPSDPNHPNFKPRTIVVDPQDSLASPYGWHDTNGVAGAEYTDTRGNNVYAQEDRDNDNAGGARPDGGASLAFDFAMDLTQAPDTYDPALTTNLFYVNNMIHDILYQYGFDESAGNFQENNYGRGGAQGDQVMADAVDGSGINNANFATPPDGFNGRMQMYEFNYTTPNRTSDLDNTIIVHEYGHGISNRLTGGPANANALNAFESGGMGEGWSDFYGLMLTQKASDIRLDTYPIGNYVLGADPTDKNGGIRSQPYSTDMSENTLTYKDIATQAIPHGVGEVWCSVLWDLNWILIEGDAGEGIAGFGFSSDFYTPLSGGNTIALQLVTEAMKLQPANPTMLDGRDAILAADIALTNGANHEAIWLTFARRGMGFSADDGGSGFNLNVTEAFDLPPFPTGEIFLDADVYAAGDTISILVRDSNVGASTLNVTIASNGGDSETVTLTESLNGKYSGSISTQMSDFVPGDGTLQVLPSEIVTATYNDADDGNSGTLVATDTADILSFKTILNADFSDASGAASSDGFSHSGAGDDWHLSTGRGLHSGHTPDDSYYFGTGEGPNGGGKYNNNSQGVLKSPSIDLSTYAGLILLDFNYFLNAETGFDLAEVRIVDNGASTTTVLDDALANTAGFAYERFDVSAFAGQSDIQVEFAFSSDFSIEREGWYVDDVRLRTPQDFGIDLDDRVISEFGGQTQGTVSRSSSSDLSVPLVVTLTNSDPTEATLPTTATIDIDETTARFTIDGEDDTLLDGPQTVDLTATAGMLVADNSLIVTDHETIDLVLADPEISENGGTTTGTLTLSNTDHSGTLTVNLFNSDTSEISIPATVDVGPSGTAIFTITGVDDGLLDGTQTVSIQTSASGYVDASTTIDVLDDEGLTLVVDDPTLREDQTTTATVTRTAIDGPFDSRVTFQFEGPTATPIPDSRTIDSTIDVQNVYGTLNDVNVTVDVTHPWNADLDMFLISPQGTTITLIKDHGLDGENFTNTVFDDEALVGIINGHAPFRGSYRPQEPLFLLDGESPLGTWTLRVTDDNHTHVGTLNSWTLDIVAIGLNPLDVTITNPDPSELTMVSQVTIPAGRGWTTFEVAGVVDNVLDGSQLTTITASAPGMNSGTADVTTTESEIPVFTSPTDGTSDLAPTISWSAVPSTDHYDLWVRNLTSGVDQVIRETNLATTSYTAPSPLPEGHYSAWVRAINTTGDVTSWSSATQFFNVGTPSAPSVTSPRTDISSQLPRFEWTQPVSATEYYLWCNNLDTRQSRIILEPNLPTSSFDTTSSDVNYGYSELPKGNYRVWVQAQNNLGQTSAWSTPVDFSIIENVPVPTVPVATGPINGIYLSDRRPTFSWTTDENTFESDIWVRNITTQQDQIIRNEHVVGNSFTPTTDLPDGDYYFWVRNYNAEGERSAWSAGDAFTIVDDVSVPSQPSIFSPASSGQGVPVVDSQPTFAWTESNFAASYELEVNNVTFNRRDIHQVGLTTLHYDTSAPLQVSLYEARVRAVNSEGEYGAWSDPVRFLITEAEVPTDNASGPSDEIFLPTDDDLNSEILIAKAQTAQPSTPVDTARATPAPTQAVHPDDRRVDPLSETAARDSAAVMVDWPDTEWWTDTIEPIPSQVSREVLSKSESRTDDDNTRTALAAGLPLVFSRAWKRFRRENRRDRSGI